MVYFTIDGCLELIQSLITIFLLTSWTCQRTLRKSYSRENPAKMRMQRLENICNQVNNSIFIELELIMQHTPDILLMYMHICYLITSCQYRKSMTSKDSTENMNGHTWMPHSDTLMILLPYLLYPRIKITSI